jgi:hypothetical protein
MLPVACGSRTGGLTDRKGNRRLSMAGTPDIEDDERESTTTTLAWAGGALIVVAIFAVFYIV